MKKIAYLIAAGIALSTMMNSCHSGTSTEQTNDSTDISSLPMTIDLKTGIRSYEIVSHDPDFKCYLTLKASIQWPTAIGNFDIKPLQDTILAIAFPDAKGKEVNERIGSYLSDVQLYDLGDDVTKIASVPDMADEIEDYYDNVRVSMLEISDVIATFRVDNEQFMGGAHPYHSSVPFSYSYSDKCVIDLAWLFKQGALDDLTSEVKASVASETGMSERQLMNSILTNGFTVSPTVYILNDEIYFHYDPYSLLPYSYGEIDAPISPYMVRDLLTEQAAKLLLDQ